MCCTVQSSTRFFRELHVDLDNLDLKDSVVENDELKEGVSWLVASMNLGTEASRLEMTGMIRYLVMFRT